MNIILTTHETTEDASFRLRSASFLCSSISIQRRSTKTLIVLLAVPFSLVGSFWFLYLLNYNMSIAVWVGIIALAGLDAETGVIMLFYLDLAYEQVEKGRAFENTKRPERGHHARRREAHPTQDHDGERRSWLGLIPIMFSHGAGADIMKRIAAPMIGGVVTSTILELIIYPAIYMIWRGREFRDK